MATITEKTEKAIFYSNDTEFGFEAIYRDFKLDEIYAQINISGVYFHSVNTTEILIYKNGKFTEFWVNLINFIDPVYSEEVERVLRPLLK